MSKAAELAALIGSQTALSNRNLIINGAMQVNQRGNKTNTSGSSVYFVDRWNLFENTGALAANLQQSTVVPSGQGFGNSLLIDCTTADSSVAASHVSVLRQIIEGQNLQSLAYGTSDAKSLTVSFWVRSTKTGTYALEIYHNATQARHQVHPYTISSADTWEYKSITFSGDTSATIDNDNQATFYVQWALSAGSDYTSGTQQTTWANFTDANRFAGQVNFFDSTSNNFYLTGVQLEVGEQATPFEHRSFSDELFRCQRYLYRLETDSADVGFINLTGWNTNDAYGPILYPVEMRAAPTLSYGAALSDFLILSASSNPVPTNIYNNGSAKRMMELGFTSTGNIVAGRSYWARITDATNGFIQWDAEL